MRKANFQPGLVVLLLIMMSLGQIHAAAANSRPSSSSWMSGGDKLSQGRVSDRPSRKRPLPPPPVREKEVPLPEQLKVSVLTWNMGEKSAPMSDVALLSGMGMNESDLTIIGVQEVENIKPRRHEGSRSREWRRLVLKTFGRTHALLSLTSLGGLQLAVLTKRSLVRHVSPLHICEVPCGVGNVLHNKGAQAALFRVGGTSFLFINAHLAAHQHRIDIRNGDVDRVMTELQNLLWFHLNQRRAGKLEKVGRGEERPSALTSVPPQRNFSPDDLVDKVDRFFIFGDLNYRLELPRDDVEVPLRRVKSGRIKQADAVERMLEYDQLTIEREKGRIFKGLEEGHIGFLPTFKFNKGRDNYDTSPKRRAPAWTDRVLYKPCAGAVEVIRYDSVPQCRHSDHRPVLAQFRVALRPPVAEGSAVTIKTEEEEEDGMEEGGKQNKAIEVDSENFDVKESEGKVEEDEDDDEVLVIQHRISATKRSKSIRSSSLLDDDDDNEDEEGDREGDIDEEEQEDGEISDFDDDSQGGGLSED